MSWLQKFYFNVESTFEILILSGTQVINLVFFQITPTDSVLVAIENKNF
jgi:hypothetical protein